MCSGLIPWEAPCRFYVWLVLGLEQACGRRGTWEKVLRYLLVLDDEYTVLRCDSLILFNFIACLLLVAVL